jgi:2-polyprenyl-3-methyl-5-hydroxy-6-metoxy-1,4-benzoquinol methylase
VDQDLTPERGNYPSVLDRVFSTNYDRVTRQLHFLGEIYDLPQFDYSLEVHNRGFFDYTLTVQHFVVLVVYADGKRVFLFAGTDAAKEQYYLPARKVSPGLSIESTVRKLSEEIFPSNSLTGFEPIARLTHTFTLDSNDRHVMHGVAYVARLLDVSDGAMQGVNAVTEISRNGMLFRFSEAREFISQGVVSKYSNCDVLRCALEWLDRFFQLRVRQPDREIRANCEALSHYRWHEIFVKPLLKVLKNSSRFEDMILRCIGEPGQFLDVSCGDSKLLMSVAKRGANLVVGNDISWGQISLLEEQLPRDIAGTILFTNHNAVFLPFRESFFDVILCKNTLHHLGSPAEFQLALSNFVKVSKKVVIVEVENPSLRFVSRIINRYYQLFLGDAGEHFFFESEFRDAIEMTLARMGSFEVVFSKYISLHANYLFAVVSRK